MTEKTDLPSQLNDWLAQDPELAAIEMPYITAVQTGASDLKQGDQALIPLIAMTVQQSLTTLPGQTNLALAAGVAPAKILEVVYQLEPVIGLPKVTAALKAIHQVFKENEIDLPEGVAKESLAAQREQGAKVQQSLYGDEIKKLLADLPDGADKALPQWLTDHFFGDFYSRPALDSADRERYELLALITLNVDFQVKAHALGSLKAGNSETRLVWSAIQLLPYVGFPLVINSVQEIHNASLALKNK